MLTETTHELRTAKPSLALRAALWVMSKRRAIFPDAADGVHAYFKTRQPPRDALMPPKFFSKYAVEEGEVEGQKVVTLHPKSGPGEWHMIYFHGGGFVLPMFKEHWPLVGAMVDRLGCSISVPLYDVVPEAPYWRAEALADAVYAKVAQDHDPARIVLNGDSAGGHMALALALRLASAGGPQPGRLALFAPWLDVTMADPDMEAVQPHDIMLKIPTLRTIGEVWADVRDPKSPACSPLYASSEMLSQLPPTRIWTGRHDLFIVDSRTFTSRLREAGVEARLYEYEGAPHVFMAVTPTKEAKDVFGLLGDFLGR